MNRKEHDAISLLAGTPAGVAASQPRNAQELPLSSLLGGVGAEAEVMDLRRDWGTMGSERIERSRSLVLRHRISR